METSNRVFLIIQKKRYWSSGFTRYYTVEKVYLEQNNALKTENALCEYLLNRHKPGEFLILAFKKGKRGFWNMWSGHIYTNGFLRNRKRKTTIDYDDSSDFSLLNEFNATKKHYKSKKKNWRGLHGFLQDAGPAGTLYPYQKNL